jgi:hypothetical protein
MRNVEHEQNLGPKIFSRRALCVIIRLNEALSAKAKLECCGQQPAAHARV